MLYCVGVIKRDKNITHTKKDKNLYYSILIYYILYLYFYNIYKDNTWFRNDVFTSCYTLK